MRFFNAMNHVVSPAAGFSFSDVGFKAICWSIRAENAGHPDITECNIHWIAELFVQTTVFSCQHTLESSTNWPTEAELTLYKRRMAAVITTYFEVGEASAHDNLIRTIDDPLFSWKEPDYEQDDASDTPEQRGRKAFKRQEVERFQAFKHRYQALKVPPRLKLKHEAVRAVMLALHAKKEERAGKRLKMADAQEVAEEASGAMWRNSSVELVLNFVPRAARLINRISFDERLLLTFPPIDNAFKFTPRTFDMARAWARKKAAVATEIHQVTDEIRGLFCDMAAPLGVDTTRFRNKQTSSDRTQPLLLLQGEIGLDLAQTLNETMLQPVASYIDLHGGQYWNAVFFGVMELEMRQKLLLQTPGQTWLAMYVILNPHTDEARVRMNEPHFMMIHEKRPLIVMACRRFWVQHKKRLIRCDTALMAFLTWLRIIRLEFATTVYEAEIESYDEPASQRKPAEDDDATIYQQYLLENGRDIRAVYDQFLDDNSVMV